MVFLQLFNIQTETSTRGRLGKIIVNEGEGEGKYHQKRGKKKKKLWVQTISSRACGVLRLTAGVELDRKGKAENSCVWS